MSRFGLLVGHNKYCEGVTLGYLSTVLMYLYFTWVFPFSATSYFYSTTFMSQTLYFLLHYIYLITEVTRHFADSDE